MWEWGKSLWLCLGGRPPGRRESPQSLTSQTGGSEGHSGLELTGRSLVGIQESWGESWGMRGGCQVR